MITVHADDHNLHSGLLDPRGDEWGPSAECPDRANKLLNAIREQNFGTLADPTVFEESKCVRRKPRCPQKATVSEEIYGVSRKPRCPQKTTLAA